MERKTGYYWAKDKSGWGVYHWGSPYPNGVPYWSMPGYSSGDEAFDEIDERPIIRHDQLPETFDIKKGMGFERHLLENYYVALPPLPIVGETVKWVTVKKGAAIDKSAGIITDREGYIL